MRARPRRYIELVGAWLNGTEPTFDGLPIAPGAHLRWSFSPELGFPPGGFSIYREREPATPELITRLEAPINAGEYVARITAAHPAAGTLEERYGPGADAIVEVLRAMRDDGPATPLGNPDDPMQLRAGDVVSLAALDPHIARGLGLYLVDRGGGPQRTTRYRVVGHWAAPAWPVHAVDLLALRATDNPGEWESPGALVVARNRSLRIEATEMGDVLVTEGDAESSLRLVPPFPIQQVELTVDEPPADGGWQAVVDGAPAEVRADPPRVIFAAPGGRAFERVDVTEVGGGSWTVRAIGYRERSGPLENLSSSTVRVGPPARAVAGAEPAVVRHVGGPPSIDLGTGSRRPGGQVEIAAAASAPRDWPGRPVRMHVGRSPATPVATAPPEAIPTSEDGTPLPALLPDEPLVAAWALDGDTRERRTAVAATLVGPGRFVDAHPSREATSLLLERGGFLEVSDRPDLQALGGELTVRVAFRPDSGLSFPTLVGNNWRESVWLGLAQVGGRYRARVYVNGRRVDSATSIASGAWSVVHVAYDGERLTLFVNDTKDSEHPLTGAVAPNPRGLLCLGAESGSRAGDVSYPYAGLLSEVSIWREALDPLHATRRLAEATPAFQYIDRGLPDGDYAYFTQGIDVFGRASAWSAGRRITVVDREPPPAPVGVSARYLPISGRVRGSPRRERVVRRETLPDGILEERIEHRWRLAFPADPAVPPTHLSALQASEPEGHGGYDLDLARPGSDGGVPRQGFEIVEAGLVDSELQLVVAEPPLAELQPTTGDLAKIALDHHAELSWGWTGRQRFEHPDVREFRVYLEPGPANALAGRAESVRRAGAADRFVVETDLAFALPAGALAGRPCQIGTSRYRVEDHTTTVPLRLTVSYAARPVIAPAAGAAVRLQLRDELATDLSRPWDERTGRPTWERRWPEVVPVAAAAPIDLRGHPPVSLEPIPESELRRLRDERVTWLGACRRLALAERDLPTASPREWVAGALLGLELGTRPTRWRILDVAWIRRTGEGSELFVLDAARRRPADPSPRFAEMTFYPGTRHEIRLPVPATFADGRGVQETLLGVSAADGQGRTRDPRGDPDRYGNEGAVSAPARLLAVNRQRPLEPPRPRVELGRADYHGHARATVSWDRRPGAHPLRYYVHRASDAAVFTRDMEQRRRGLGHYAGMDPVERLRDDPDLLPWLAARHPEVLPGWEAALFPSPGTPGWEAATPLWRAWYERFYPALTDPDLQALAVRTGNEAAFTRVNRDAVDGTTHVDRVPGVVRNRYLYRLQTETAALAQSRALGPVSDPQAAPRTRPPAPPALTAVEPGDRSVTLDWSLSADPDVVGYRVYRAAPAAELEDLRWLRPDRDPRLIRTEEEVPDPRLRARARSVELSHDADVADLLAVYRADEFDRRSAPDSQPRALNYLPETGSWDPDRLLVSSLRRIPDGTPVVVLYRDGASAVRATDRRTGAPPLRDEGLPGGTDYVYRVVGVTEGGLASDGSRPVRARALEVDPPGVPEVVHDRRPALTPGMDEITLTSSVEHEAYEVMVQRREDGSVIWEVVSPWRPAAAAPFIDTVEAGRRLEYRVWCRTPAGSICVPPPTLFSAPGR